MDIVRLRRAFWPVQDIARHYKISSPRVVQIIQKWLNQQREETSKIADGLREQEVERLDTLCQSLWPMVAPYEGKSIAEIEAVMAPYRGMDDDEFKKKAKERGELVPNMDAIDRYVRISARRSAMLGLDSPTKIANTTPDGKAATASVVISLDESSMAKIASLLDSRL